MASLSDLENATLRRSELPTLLGAIEGVTVREVEEKDGIAQGVSIEWPPYHVFIRTRSVAGKPGDEDIDSVFYWTGFTRDEAIDLEFINDFNGRGGAACATLTDRGVEIHNTVLLAGLPRLQAEHALVINLYEFRRNVRDFNQARNDRVSSTSDNR
jgi:hypothetical protein